MKRLLPIVLSALLIAGFLCAPSQAVLPQPSSVQVQAGVGIYRAGHVQVGDHVLQVNSATSSSPTDERMFTVIPPGFPSTTKASLLIVYEGQLYLVPMIYPLASDDMPIIIRTDPAAPIDFANWGKNLDAATTKVNAERKAGTW